MKDKLILLGITGGIAAYKSAELCRLFVKAGAAVQVVMSESACEFITPLTLETLSGRPVHVRMFDRPTSKVTHIDVGAEADLLVIAPATADYLARSASGRASDLISAVTLAFDGPVLAAPAMNTNMWRNPATQRNIETLERRHGWRMVSPGTGELACGWTGPGRMAEPREIFEATAAVFQRDLDGKNIVVTAGPTVEDIDPVRYLSNRSSGKMGYAIAREAAARGASVTLISGPTALPCPPHVSRIDIRSARELESALSKAAGSSDAVIMAAAVADFRPDIESREKLKKQANAPQRTLTLVQNPDILKGLGERFGKSGKPLLVGFALETSDLVEAATKKLASKGANIIVGNLAADGIGGDTNSAVIVDDTGGRENTGSLSKTELAKRILDKVSRRITEDS